MNTPVSFEIKQLLYDNGWRYELGVDETGYRVEHSLAEQRWNEGDLTYIDITIGDVVMWLYEKYGIWIEVSKLDGYQNLFFYTITGSNGFNHGYKITVIEWDDDKCDEMGYNNKYKNSPTEAYEAAIEYTLKNLI